MAPEFTGASPSFFVAAFGRDYADVVTSRNYRSKSGLKGGVSRTSGGVLSVRWNEPLWRGNMTFASLQSLYVHRQVHYTPKQKGNINNRVLTPLNKLLI